MPSFRRPWPINRRDTDSVQQNAQHTVGDEKADGVNVSPISSRESPQGRTTEAVAAEKDLKEFSTLHRWDPNLEESKREAIENAVRKHDTEAEVHIDHELEENSPYPEVASVVRTGDDMSIPANTFRAWFLGMIFTTIGSGLNCLFSLRNPSITITSIVAQLLSFPLGLGLAACLPKKQFTTFGHRWSLNPGPFNMKEHALITIMANVTFGNGVAYSTYGLEALLGFYKLNLGWGFALLFTISTQMIGFGLAGIFRRFLVYPAAMIWPTTLPNTALFYSLHDRTKSDPTQTGGWSIARYRWFMYVMIGSFVWYWFPGWIWQGLSVFAFVTWIRPNNVVVNQLFGGFTGLSLIPITFDWTYITAYIYSPLIPPWHAIGNTMIGLVIFIILTGIGIQYTNSFYGQYLPMSDSSSYDNTQQPYNVSKILTSQYTLDADKYKAYSPLFLSTTFAICYGLSFASIISVIVHTGLYHWREIWYRFKASRRQEDDIHQKLMKRYPEAPDWWFIALFLVMFGIGMGTMVGYPTHMTWWSYIIAMLISIFWFVPIGMVQAITNIQIGLNVFTEFIVGYMTPGRPIAMMAFKTYGYITMSQGLYYTQDLKLGHYMKVAPRTLFWAQGIASLWGSIVQVAVLYWAFGSIEGICTPDQSNRFTCPNGRVFFNASIIWGVIGPKRMFSPGATYAPLQYYWLIGAFTPVIFYFLARRFPKTSLRYLNAPVMFGALGYIPPATPLIYASWGVVGFVFNKLIRSRRRGWWMTYNYITSAALDSGLAISTIVIFFALYLPNQTPPQWWGNTVVASTMDNADTAIRKILNPGETFGPKTW